MKCFDVKNGDVVINNDISIVSGLELERQMITSVLGTNTGEWFLNENEGINFRLMLTKKPDYDLIRAEIISGLNQINSDYTLTKFSHTLINERNLLLSLVITKKSGEKISLDLNNEEVKKEYLSFASPVENLVELLTTLITIEHECELDNNTLTVKFEGEATDENIINAQSKINSVMPDYITIAYEFEKPKSITKITIDAETSGTAQAELSVLTTTLSIGTIDWGDGTVEEYNSWNRHIHNYSAKGIYTIAIECEIEDIVHLNYIYPDVIAIEVGNSVTYLPSYSLKGSKLTYVKLPRSITKIDMDAFAGSWELTAIHYEGTEEEWNAIDKATDWDYSTSITEIIYNA